MPNKRTAIARFLIESAHPDLAGRWHKGLETQVLTAKDDGVPFFSTYQGRRWRGYHKPGQLCTPNQNSQDEHERKRGCRFWKDFRIPWGAMGEPSYEDSEQTWDLEDHALGIGSTGWNWEHKVSEWFAFDFDSITNHEGYGRALSDADLASVLASVQSIPWVEVRKSKSGKGVHLYVFLQEPLGTANHSEHAAAARAVLDRMSALAGAHLNASVDCVGGNVWLWHRDSGPGGWEQVKSGTGMPPELIPEDWRRHLSVTKGRARKAPVTTGTTDGLDDILNRRRKVELDDDHKRLLAWLAQRTASLDWDWNQDQWMLRTHTFALAEAHKELGLRGIYYTNSQGHDLLTGNCFMFPEPNGAWEVRRFGEGGVDEHPSWDRDPGGWTRCMFNSPATLDDACRAHGGSRDAEGAFHFADLSGAQRALLELGYETPGLDGFLTRPARLFTKKGHLVCRFKVDGDETNPATGWIRVTKGGKWWERTFSFREDSKPVELPDEIVRAVAGGGAHTGFWIFSRDRWIAHPTSNAQNVLMALHGVDQATAKMMLGAAVINHWQEVNEPFGPEYPGDRSWNRRGARLSMEPEEGPCPHWDMILSHLGRGLDEAVAADSWCQKYQVHSGSEYLRLWVASLFQSPKARLPYLFFFGEQNTGKSLLHESLAMFFQQARGYVLANQALVSKSRFNGELAGALLCAVEEINLRVEREAYNRMKDWVTGKRISIRALHKDARDEENCTHWIHCANSAEFCPVEWGDTRVVMVHVAEFEGEEIPKDELLETLRGEAAGFLHSILNMDIPPAPGRLRVPTIVTAAKEQQVRANMNPLQEFMETEVRGAPGSVIVWASFFERFQNWLKPHQRQYWTPASTARKFPAEFPKGKYGGKGAMHIGNMEWADGTSDGGVRGTLTRNPKNGRLVKV
jgi:hypothetical protein